MDVISVERVVSDPLRVVTIHRVVEIVDPWSVEYNAVSTINFTVDCNVVLIVEPISVEYNIVPRTIFETLIVDPCSVEYNPVFKTTFTVFNVDVVILELVVILFVVMVDPDSVEYVQIEPNRLL